MPILGDNAFIRVSSATSGYPLDGISNIAAAYSVRRLLTSYTGDALRLRRGSDNAESDFGFDVNGDLDTAAITTWLGGATGYVKTWYDQSGAGLNAIQTLSESQPRFSTVGLNSKPSLEWFDTNNRYYLLSGLAWPQQENILVAFSTTNSGTQVVCGGSPTTSTETWRLNHSADRPLAYFSATNYQYFAANTLYRNGNPHVLSIYIHGNQAADITSAETYLDGSELARGTSQLSGGPTLRADTSLLNLRDSFASEVIISTGKLSTADHNTIGSSMADYFGLTWNTIT